NQTARGHACPFLRGLVRVRAAFVHSFSDQRMDEVVAALVAMVVKDHNLAAAEFLFRHAVGPELRFNADPDTADVVELERLKAQGQTDSLGNSRLSPEAALALERTKQLAASVETVALDLGDTDLGRRLLEELKRAGLADLAAEAKAYSDAL